MTAQTLRDAAKVLRERAEAATPGPWYWEPESTEDWPSGDQSLCTRHREADDKFDPTVLHGWGYDASGIEDSQGDRDYIATMHPGVRLALARWLEDIAAGWMWDEDPEDVETPDGWPLTLEESMDMHALTVAREILGETA